MGMQINTNIAALNAHRNLSNTQNDLSKSLEKLSSGLRINRAADDAAGLSISEGLRSQVNGMNVAARNAQDGIAVIQTAEGALTEVHSILQRMRDLTVQAGNDSNNAESRTAIKTEIDGLASELNRIGANTEFNGINLMDGSSKSFQIGANGNEAGANVSNVITVDLTNLATALDGVATLEATGADLTATITVDTQANAALAIEAIDTAIGNISTSRAELGAKQNRFESAINSLNVSRENLQAAESRIRDVDMAAEMVNFTRSNILSQAGTAMLAQANQSNQGVLQLLG
ncbi:flagellin [Glutamicibacter sp. ZJUTW]|uniref:flagellin N-terminal helical domain-containing protein n=1 Tax=Glutamicibacter sp. ZJUTW TaxID=1155384 RepID=UPI0011F0B9AD|nr:flagellin [Glutamicibacter sp. ZJUTW]QEP08897.1 flagellin [Glutamicibacter sp. ZJUTW]